MTSQKPYRRSSKIDSKKSLEILRINLAPMIFDIKSTIEGSKEKFALQPEDCEFRFNCGLGKENIYAKCKKILKQYVKSF